MCCMSKCSLPNVLKYPLIDSEFVSGYLMLSIKITKKVKEGLRENHNLSVSWFALIEYKKGRNL